MRIQLQKTSTWRRYAVVDSDDRDTAGRPRQIGIVAGGFTHWRDGYGWAWARHADAADGGGLSTRRDALAMVTADYTPGADILAPAIGPIGAGPGDYVATFEATPAEVAIFEVEAFAGPDKLDCDGDYDDGNDIDDDFEECAQCGGDTVDADGLCQVCDAPAVAAIAAAMVAAAVGPTECATCGRPVGAGPKWKGLYAMCEDCPEASAT